MKKSILPIFIIVTLSFALILGMMIGVQYLAGLFLDFHFTRSSGPILMAVGAFIGLIILIPISILLESVIRVILDNSKLAFILSEILQFIVFFMYMRWSSNHFNIATFNNISSELIFYIISYLFFYGMEKVGHIVDKEDEKSLNSN